MVNILRIGLMTLRVEERFRTAAITMFGTDSANRCTSAHMPARSPGVVKRGAAKRSTMILKTVPFASLVAGFAATAFVNEPDVALPATALIEARQTAYGLSAATFHHMRTRIEAGADVRPLAYSARRLERWARLLPMMFPPGSDGGCTRALDAVWRDRSDFEQKAGAYAAAAARLAALAEADDRPGFAAQWTITQRTCDACHAVYREESAPEGC